MNFADLMLIRRRRLQTVAIPTNGLTVHYPCGQDSPAVFRYLNAAGEEYIMPENSTPKMGNFTHGIYCGIPSSLQYRYGGGLSLQLHRRPSVQLGYYSLIKQDGSTNPVEEFSISFWVAPLRIRFFVNFLYTGDDSWACVFSQASSSQGHTRISVCRDGNTGGDMSPFSTSEFGKWKHYVLTYSNGVLTMYDSGVVFASKPHPPKILSRIRFACFVANDLPDRDTCHYAGIRIYNRALTDKEVLALSREFTPVYE